MTRLFKDKDFVKIGVGSKISYVNYRNSDIRAFCPSCKKWTFLKYLRSFINSDGEWIAIYECRECGR